MHGLIFVSKKCPACKGGVIYCFSIFFLTKFYHSDMSLPLLFIDFDKEEIVSPILNLIKYRKPPLKAAHLIELLMPRLRAVTSA